MTHWSTTAARRIHENLSDRRGIKQALADTDEDVIDEMMRDFAEIIRKAQAEGSKP